MNMSLDPPCLLVKESPIAGRGLFTTKAWATDDVLMVIAGELIDASEAQRRERGGNHSIYCLTDDRFIDPPPGNKSRYLNHSCTPNAIPETRDATSLNLKALRDIPPGEEITIDYDFPEIYETCRRCNPLCRQEECPIMKSRGD